MNIVKYLVKNAGANVKLIAKQPYTNKNVTAYQIADDRHHTELAAYLNSIIKSSGICLTLLTVIVIPRLGKKSPVKLLKVDQIQVLQRFLT